MPAWLLRSVLLADSQAGGFSLRMPRARCHGIDRHRLAWVIGQKDLPLDLDPDWGPTVVLLAEPEEDWLAATADPLVLREYWRLLYHARVYIAVKSLLPSGQAVQDRIERIGRSVFSDARFVLMRERFLPPTAGDAETLARFVAVYAELRAFSPDLLPRYFAAIEDLDCVFNAFARDLDPVGLLRQTRLPGAAAALEPQPPLDPAEVDAPADESEESLDDGPPTFLRRRESRAARVGNHVRAAILRERVRRRAGKPPISQDHRANTHFARFAARLATAMPLQDVHPADWAAALVPLLAQAADSWRNAQSRLLYDLQKVCTDSEREVYALDAFGWLFTFGRRPLRRPVPVQRMTLICKHLRSAIARLARCRLEPAERRRLDAMLHAALAAAEDRLRDTLRPAVTDALDAGGLDARGTVEQVAREKVVEEFVDTMVRQGYARMGDLRDTLSRNQLKLHDLTGVGALLYGDQLLQVDRHLKEPLDGVYHAGEAYLRFFQRLSSLLFATQWGRLFTYYMLIPFGGAFLLLEVLGHTVGRLIEALGKDHVEFTRVPAILLLGLFLLGLVNVPTFRAGVVRLLSGLGRGLRWVFVDWPGWLMCRRFVQALIASRPWRVLVRYGLKPLLVTWLAWGLLPPGTTLARAAPILAAVFLGAAVVLNSRGFRMAAHVLMHSAVVLWVRLFTDVLQGLFRVIVRVFSVLLERLERLLYAVDEWFRFRAGQGRGALLAKALLGGVWGLFAYCLRFVVTLLAEPQFNPIKHFPVVTVSHKIILPTQPLIAGALESVGLSSVQANAYAATTVFLIPGVFGFLAWELKENWKLYAANRARTLRPVRMGRHGETFAQLLRPGLHSGTLPRTFARLRHAATDDTTRRRRAALHRQEETLEHIREAVADFLRRELAGLLNRHPAWADAPIAVSRVDLAATRIRAWLDCPALGEPAALAFEQHDGWIVAGIDEMGWMASLPKTDAAMLSLGLLGLYQQAGVDLVREQIDALFAPLPIRWSIRGNHLLVRTGLRFGAEVRYSLRPGEPTDLPEPAGQDLAPQAVPELLLRRNPLRWTDWARAWDAPVADREELQRITQDAAGVLARPAASARTAGHGSRITNPGI